MILTLQFLLVAILPVSLIFLAVKMRRSESPRPLLVRQWTLTLIAMAVWASTLLRFYVGMTLPPALIFTVGFIGRHVLSLAMFGVLLTTSTFLLARRGQVKIATVTSLTLIGLAVLLDPAIWQFAFVRLTVGGWGLRYFDIWAGVWVSACLLPLIAAWIMAQQVAGGLPLSLFRNHTQYWALTLLLFMAGIILAVVQQRDQPLWQEMGVVMNILAAVLGTLTFTSSQLPDLPALLRRVLTRVSSGLFLFALAAGAFYLVRQLPPRGNEILILTLAAAVFTAVVLLFNRWGVIAGRPAAQLIPSREQTSRNETSGADNNLLPVPVPGTFASLAHPQQLGEQLLEIARAGVAAEDAWLFWSEPGVGGRLILRGLAAVMEKGELEQSSGIPTLPQVAEFPVGSPFAAHLRGHFTPLLQNDLFSLPAFDALTSEERQWLLSWQRVLYIPMHIQTRLIGVLALGKKQAGAAYERQDIVLLQSLVALAGPFLVQAGFTTTLERINDYIFRQNQAIGREKQDLEARLALHHHLLDLITPELRQPLLAITDSLERSDREVNGREQVGDGRTDVRDIARGGWQVAEEQGRLETMEVPFRGDWRLGDSAIRDPQSALDEVRMATQRLRGMVERLVALATLVRGQRPLCFAALQLEAVVEEAVRGLATMAEARRVRITFNRSTTLPLILGDAAQLQTALHYLLHNAIKFNRIGGTVTLDVGLTVSNVYLRMTDTGVGIPAEKVADLWQGFAQLPHAENSAGGQVGRIGNRMGAELPVPLQDYRPLGRGLTITHWIVTAHGGRLEAQSVYGRGSTFTLYLPLDFEIHPPGGSEPPGG